MGIQDRYLSDIRQSIDVYKSLYKMQISDKVAAIKYIGDFYKKFDTAEGKKEIIDNAECYRKLMCNIHLFRWLEIERNLANREVIQAMKQSEILAKTSKELATTALDIFKTLQITPGSNGYGLNADVLKHYMQMSQIETSHEGEDTSDYDDDIEEIGDEIAEDESGIAFDDIDIDKVGADIESGFDDDFDDIEEIDESELMGDEGQEETSLANGSADESESGKKDLDSERKRIMAEQEAESNRVEIPINIEVSKDTEEAFGDLVDMQYINALMKTIDELYQTCFSGIQSPDGILTPNGVLNFEQLKGDTKKQWHFNHSQGDKLQSNTQVYRNYMNMILYALGVLNGGTQCQKAQSNDQIKQYKKRQIDLGRSYLGDAIGETDKDTGRFPNIKHLSKGNVYYPFMHEAFMTGYYALCTGLKKEQQEKGYQHNTVKVTSYPDLSKWIRARLRECLLKAIEDSNLGPDSDTFEIDNVCQKMLDAIKNIVIIADKQKSFLTVRVCQNTIKFNPVQFERLLNEYNTSVSGGTSGIRAIVKDVSNDVATIDLVLDEKKYSSSTLLASQVIDSIIESGQIPSWKNAIIGRGEKGIVRYNFTKSDKCAVQIYGASGSGKGIMTSALLQNALIDNCSIFYFDGKPDNGASLAKIQWDRDKEAAVFNGLSGGQNTFPGELEKFQHGLRDFDRLYEVEDIIPDFKVCPMQGSVPIDWPFSSVGGGATYVDRDGEQKRASGAELRKLLIDVSRTLQAFEFITNIVTIRANLRDEGIPHRDDFCVLVIDEIQDAARNEMTVRRAMDSYMKQVEQIEVYKKEQKVTKAGVEIVPKRDGKIKDFKNWDKDPGYLFCKRWINWANSVANPQWQTLVTKQLRNSRCTIITIFQQNSWFTQDDKGIGTQGSVVSSRIGHMMRELAQKTIRIVGKGGLQASQNTWGDNPPEKYAWDNKVREGRWAIATGEGVITNDAIIVNPFKVYTTDLGDGAKQQFDDRFNGSQNCRTSKYDLTDEATGQKKADPNGLDSYTHYMFNNLHNELIQHRDYGLTPEDVLCKGYEYFDEALRKNGLADGIQNYFYQMPNMVAKVKIEVDESSQSAEETPEDLQATEEDAHTFDLHDKEQSGDFLDMLNDEQFGEDEDAQIDLDTTEAPIANTQSTQVQEANSGTNPFAFGGTTLNNAGSQYGSDDLDIGLDLDGLDDESESSGDFRFDDQTQQGVEVQQGNPVKSPNSVGPNPWNVQFDDQFWDTLGNQDTQSQDEVKTQVSGQRPIKISRNNAVVNTVGVPEHDSDGFDTFISDFSVSNATDTQGKYRNAGMESLEQILDDTSLDNVTKLQIIGDIIKRNNVRVDEADCIPLESQMMQEDVRTDPRTGRNVFQTNQSNRPHVLGETTMRVQDRQATKFRGTSVETGKTLQQRYELLLDVIGNYLPDQTVVRMLITSNTVQVNGRNLHLGDIINNDVKVDDIFNLHRTVERFENLKVLTIDTQILGCIQGELGKTNPIPDMFLLSTSLESIAILGSRRQISLIDRDGCENLDDETLQILNNQDYKDKIDVVSAQYLSDSAYNTQPVQVKRRIEKTSTRMNSRSFGQKNRRFTSNQVKRSGAAAIRSDQSSDTGRIIRRQVSGAMSGINRMMHRFGNKSDR